MSDTLRAEHTNDYDYAKAPETLDDAEQERRHPVVRMHPATGERGLSKGESRDILRLPQSYVTRPESVVRVSWEPNRRRQLRRPAPPPEPGDRGGRHPGRHRRGGERVSRG
ncbi:hypothetical protein ACFQ05_24760 [Amycolatopsis umgeniensis]|uniref:Uncharacterized protein n=1 Tax=Amycolatopsis umgeniensis TaxID=336628 RepID=A0A841BB10_9PSEU|nr:hypothetical protein [Amycolatopsis umgeniensis]MBB5856091.1 hypothetical protein [Amycolatopsis umgeniensis]